MIGFRTLRRLSKAARLLILAVAACVAAIASAACGGAKPADGALLVHDAYIWQRQWTPSLDRAVDASSSRVRAWRVLAAELDARGRITESSPHLDVLTRSGRPVVPVIRISGRVSDWDEPGLIRLGRTLVQRWRDAGVNVTGVEVDHDCPTASLRRYAAFLATFRTSLRQAPSVGVTLTLSITALPSWLDSAHVRDVLQQVDEAVLQVHAVQHPEAGLFDRDHARAWADAWSEVSSVPFRVALPTYGSRVAWTSAGRISAIESEARTFTDPTEGREIFATPLDVGAFVDALRNDRERPSHLTGLVWFRVPTAEDERAWGLDTWHAVMDGRASSRRSEFDALVRQSATMPGLYDIYIRNRGDIDAMAPERVTISSSPGACESADAVAPYAMEKSRQAIEFRRVTPRLLAKSGQTLVGWVRCAAREIQVDVRS